MLLPAAEEEPLSLDTLPADASRSVFELLDARALAQVRACSKDASALVDSIAADLLARHMRECRLRACRRRTFLPRGTEPAGFVGSIMPRGPISLLGGMCCGGSGRQRSLHGHVVSSSSAFKAASYCGRQALLIRSDGALLGDGPGMRGAELMLDCRCDADVNGCDGCDGADAQMDEWTAEEEAAMQEQEEEAASRGWGWRPRDQTAGLGLGSPSLPVEAKLLALPEAAMAVCACPGRSHVLGQSGAVYSARWHGRHACHGPSASLWTCWMPPSPALRVVEISALSAHVLLRTGAASAMSFGEPQEGKLGYLALRSAYVPAPRLVEALLGHTIVGVAAGGRHSLFLTHQGGCFTAGANHAGQCGRASSDHEALGPIRRMRLPDDCARLVQVSAGHAHTLLLSHTGRVYACGLNDRGQCGIEPLDGDGACVPEPTLVSGLLPHTVRAIEAAPSLSVFEVEEEATGGAGGVPNDSDANVVAAAGNAPLPTDAPRTGKGHRADDSYSLWLAGHVEAFNIPGTNAQAGGLRFLPSCYRWQLASVA